MVKSFRDLFIWQSSVDLATQIAEITQTFPSRQRYVLVDQMLRASVSVASNIAEGAGRLTSPDYCRFLGIARGSLHELSTHIEIAVRCSLIDRTIQRQLEKKIALIGTGINRLICRMRKNAS